MQMEALECGAASLAMILAHYGRWIPLEQLRKECGVSRDGSNMKSIYQVAQKYKLQPRAFRCDAEALSEKCTVPAIAFWQNNHFIVVDGFSGSDKSKKVFVNDPALGKVKYPIKEFQDSYSNICMTFEPA